MKYFLIVLFVCGIVAGCSSEELECAQEDMYIDGYQPITWPDGRVFYQPIWRCP